MLFALLIGLVSIPMSVAMPAIGVEVPMQQVGISETSELQPPDNPYAVGWLATSSHHLVLDGHVDWNHRPGPFFKLHELQVGDEIDVTDEDGNTTSYTVQWTQLLGIDEIDQGLFYPQDSDNSLMMITCGGIFTDGEYQSRRVVWASE